MRRTRVTLIVNCLWLAAFAAAGAAIFAIGVNWLSIGAAGLAAVAAAVLSTLIARSIEHDVQLKLAQLGQAVGVASSRDLREGMTVEAIVANLAGRLERASQFKAAFGGLAEAAPGFVGDSIERQQRGRAIARGAGRLHACKARFAARGSLCCVGKLDHVLTPLCFLRRMPSAGCALVLCP